MGKFKCLIGTEGATEEQVSLQVSLNEEVCWPEEYSAEFQAPVIDTGIQKCGRAMCTERITADVWSALESMEGLKPVAGNTMDGVKVLLYQGSEVEAIHGSNREDSDAVGDSEPDLVDDDTSSEEDSDSGGKEKKLVDSAGSVQVDSVAEAGVEKVEWESM